MSGACLAPRAQGKKTAARPPRRAQGGKTAVCRSPGSLAAAPARPHLAPWQQSTVHTHTTLCDGSHTPARMAAAALRQGFCTLGFSGHSPLPGQDWCMPPARLALYRAEIARLQKKYAGRLEILCGIEWDACSFELLRPQKPGLPPLLGPEYAPGRWDYWIGSVHMLACPGSGKLLSVDYGPDFAALAAAYGDGAALVRDYYRALAALVLHKPAVIGHFDLPRKLNGGGRVFSETGAAYQNAALGALSAADPSVSLLEINTGAMARGFLPEPYPAQFLLRAWRGRGGRVILTADAHSAGALRYAYTAAAQWAKAAGYTEACVLRAAGPQTVPL